MFYLNVFYSPRNLQKLIFYFDISSDCTNVNLKMNTLERFEHPKNLTFREIFHGRLQIFQEWSREFKLTVFNDFGRFFKKSVLRIEIVTLLWLRYRICHCHVYDQTHFGLKESKMMLSVAKQVKWGRSIFIFGTIPISPPRTDFLMTWTVRCTRPGRSDTNNRSKWLNWCWRLCHQYKPRTIPDCHQHRCGHSNLEFPSVSWTQGLGPKLI